MATDHNCPHCGKPSSVSAAFCSECGGRLPVTCSECSFENTSQSKFCGGCGKVLGNRALDRPAPAPPRAERRQVTVMFCDLAGSTELAGRLDPEDLHEVLEAYRAACNTSIAQFDGFVAKYLGDGLVVLFGYPKAHEDDAERAVRAGLDVVGQIDRLNASIASRHNVVLAVRVGIHTGVVVAGDVGGDGQSPDVVGETPNIAARLQEVAEPNTVVISADTLRLVSASFDVEPLGSRRLKGVSRSFDAYRPLRERHRDSYPSANDLEMVGRSAERCLLVSDWNLAQGGAGRIAVIVGDAGIGKSCLKRAIKRQVEIEPDAVILETRCSPYHENSPFYPITQFLRNERLRFTRDDSVQVKLQKLESFLEQRGVAVAETAPLLAALLDVPAGDVYPSLMISAEAVRERTMELLMDLIVRRSAHQSILFVIENLHWADPSTMEFLTRVASRMADLHLFVVMTTRPADPLPFENEPYFRRIVLDRLTDEEAKDVIRQVASDRYMPDAVIDQIIQRADGVPLFVEELTRMVLESIDRAGSSQKSDYLIPASLSDSLMARLDRLDTGKVFAQTAAVIGREFSLALLAAVTDHAPMQVQLGLDRLVDAQIIQLVDSLEGEVSYRFRHALLQDAAYQSLLKSRRQTLHGTIASTLETRFPNVIVESPQVLGEHFEAASLPQKAIAYFVLAGTQSQDRSANREAITYFQRSKTLLISVEDLSVRLPVELEIQSRLGMTLGSMQGYGAPEVGAAFARAGEICAMFGEHPQLFQVLRGLAGYHLVRGEISEARAMCETLARMAVATGDTLQRAEAALSLAQIDFWSGNFPAAKEAFYRVLDAYDPATFRQYASSRTEDIAVSALCYLVNTNWAMGYTKRAQDCCNRAAEMAAETKHPFTVAWSKVFPGALAILQRDPESARTYAMSTLKYCQEHGYIFWTAFATMHLGWSLFWLGQQDEGLAMMQQCLAFYEATGANIGQPYNMGLLAEALHAAGRSEEASVLLNSALTRAQTTGETISEMGLHRLKGEFHASQAEYALAEAEFAEAIRLARQCGALFVEMQAITGLARVQKATGRSNDARQSLEQVLQRFEEGFETRDVQEAIELLSNL